MVQQKSVFKEKAWTSWDEIMSWAEGGIKLVRMITPKCNDAIPGAEMNHVQGKLGFEEK